MSIPVSIPEDLKKRYEHLSSYKPMEVAVTDIHVREWKSLIERIAQRDRQIAVYDSGGFKDADALAEKYLDTLERIAALEATVREQQETIQRLSAQATFWVCAKCGYGSAEHGMASHSSYQCVYEPVIANRLNPPQKGQNSNETE
jgi:hypothetical protein